jgi:hypothetical protein
MFDSIFIAASKVWTDTTDAIAALNKSLQRFAGDFAGDLELFTSFYLARFIIWRELRKQHLM